LLKRAGVILSGLLLTGVLVQLPVFPFGGEGVFRSSLAAAAARLLGQSPERVGVDATEFLTVRKVATAGVFSLVAAFAVGFWRRESGGWLLAAIPRLSASTVGVVRIAYAAGLIWALWYTGPVEPGFPLALHRDAGPLANWSWLHTLAAHDRASIWIHGALIGAVAAFGVGVFSRVAVVAVAALTLLQTLVLLQRQSAHDWGLPLATLFLLTIVPWGDGLSIDAAWRRYRGRPQPLRGMTEYGLSVWIPGFAMGVAFLAAAFAKLDSSGLAWITGGAARYHFVTDAGQARVDWGLDVAANLGLAQVASLGAVVFEALFIGNILARGWVARLMFGIAAAGLLTGFLLFQGVFWSMWWVMLLAFLPWDLVAHATAKVLRRDAGPRPSIRRDEVRVDPPAGSMESGWLRSWQIAVLSAFVLQQVVFSGIRLEMEPLVSDYGMYSWTYGSTQEFDEYLADKRRIWRFEIPGDPTVDVAERLSDMPGATDVITTAIREQRTMTRLTDPTREAVRAVLDAYQRRYQESLVALHVTAEEPRFDWASGRFAAHRRADYGILPLGMLSTD